MIQIKTSFFGWVPVTKEKALEYARCLYENVTNGNEDEFVEYINTKRIKGILFTREELEKGSDS